jgi:hypothetical protein
VKSVWRDYGLSITLAALFLIDRLQQELARK